MVTGSPVFKKYVNWQDRERFARLPNDGFNLRNSLLEKLPHEVILPTEHCIDLRDIDKFVQDKWSAYADERKFQSHYFFKLEADAVAFKLRWL